MRPRARRLLPVGLVCALMLNAGSAAAADTVLGAPFAWQGSTFWKQPGCNPEFILGADGSWGDLDVAVTATGCEGEGRAWVGDSWTVNSGLLLTSFAARVEFDGNVKGHFECSNPTPGSFNKFWVDMIVDRWNGASWTNIHEAMVYSKGLGGDQCLPWTFEDDLGQPWAFITFEAGKQYRFLLEATGRAKAATPLTTATVDVCAAQGGFGVCDAWSGEGVRLRSVTIPNQRPVVSLENTGDTWIVNAMLGLDIDADACDYDDRVTQIEVWVDGGAPDINTEDAVCTHEDKLFSTTTWGDHTSHAKAYDDWFETTEVNDPFRVWLIPPILGIGIMGYPRLDLIE
ncbi:MAG: hypothetical protein ACREN5_07415, partial [Gemmatimonadales bacterium]